MSIISLTTDFGLSDGYVGVMKGVILGIAPDARLVDLSHEIAPQDVLQAAYVLAGAIPYFPQGTIHLVVVDPGVGSARRAIVVRTDAALFIGPDNGVLTPALADSSAQAWVLDRPEFRLPEVSATFHGRDIFAPAAGHLARGAPLEAMARSISDPVRLTMPTAQRTSDGGIRGEVVYIDRFGNLITNIPGSWLTGESAQCYLAGRLIPGPYHTYSEAPTRAPLALISSGGALEIAVRDGNAQQVLGADIGAPVLVSPA
jgi:S-adenosylmethionine hydrolase